RRKDRCAGPWGSPSGRRNPCWKGCIARTFGSRKGETSPAPPHLPPVAPGAATRPLGCGESAGRASCDQPRPLQRLEGLLGCVDGQGGVLAVVVGADRTGELLRERRAPHQHLYLIP